MKIEFRKVPQTKKEFTSLFDSVKLEGTFSKITPSLVKVEAQLLGDTNIQCSRCGVDIEKKLNEKKTFILQRKGLFEKQESQLKSSVEEMQKKIMSALDEQE